MKAKIEFGSSADYIVYENGDDISNIHQLKKCENVKVLGKDKYGYYRVKVDNIETTCFFHKIRTAYGVFYACECV